MNDLEDAFNEITAFNFLLDQLQEAVDAGEFQRVIDTTAALNAFYVPYCNNWDNKFKKAWNHIVKETLKETPPEWCLETLKETPMSSEGG